MEKIASFDRNPAGGFGSDEIIAFDLECVIVKAIQTQRNLFSPQGYHAVLPVEKFQMWILMIFTLKWSE